MYERGSELILNKYMFKISWNKRLEYRDSKDQVFYILIPLTF